MPTLRRLTVILVAVLVAAAIGAGTFGVVHHAIDASASPAPGWFAPYVDATLLPPGDAAIERILAVFELEKAVYELRYELDNRPDWVGIPVAGIERLMHQAAEAL